MVSLTFKIPLKINIPYELRAPMVTIESTIIRNSIQESIEREKTEKFSVRRAREALTELNKKLVALENLETNPPEIVDCGTSRFEPISSDVRNAVRHSLFSAIWCSTCAEKIGPEKCTQVVWEYDFDRPDDVHRLFGYNLSCPVGHLIFSNITSGID